MGESKHTPGPWMVDDASGEGAVGVFDENGQRICYMSEDAMAPDGLRSRAEDDTNARLVAAAPQMLEALQWWMRNGGEHSPWLDDHADHCPGCLKVRAAIKAATGGET